MFIPCNVVLIKIVGDRVTVMKELRRICPDLSLQQVKHLIANLPQVVLRDVHMEIADRAARELALAGAESCTEKPDLSTDIHDWLREKQTETQVQAASPHAWQQFRPILRSGDELWRFSSPDVFWMNMCGRAGYAVVRHGNVIDTCLTSLS